MAGCPLVFTVKGSYEDVCNILPKLQAPPNSAVFHYAKYCCPEMEVALPKNCSSCCFSNKGRKELPTLPLCHLPVGERVEIVNDRAYDAFMTAENGQNDLDVRLGFELCPEEQDFICKRKRYVAAALKKVLHLEEDLQDDEV
ncbi:cytosolic phospholipase A2 epsilon-like [Elgaria multicarinata webbii]|uniref:cytosolic phospholipase A2 epsilon-like n=1 Tax=Elgaria multicarinata webbii TaxID=159646 RepID=UPI002FCD1C1C